MNNCPQCYKLKRTIASVIKALAAASEGTKPPEVKTYYLSEVGIRFLAEYEKAFGKDALAAINKWPWLSKIKAYKMAGGNLDRLCAEDLKRA